MLGGVLLLALMFGYFKLDTATKGYYTGRLQMGLAAAILAVVVAVVFYRQATVQLIGWLL